ncbi:MAG: hypothetical protein AAF512_23330 [Pseudomonadota bacterium]
MLLRESSQAKGEAAELEIVTGLSEGDGNVLHGALLIQLTDAVRNWQVEDVHALSDALEPLLGAQGVVDAIGVASSFNGITRVADATGIPLDPNTESSTGELREVTQINAFAPASKWVAHAD